MSFLQVGKYQNNYYHSIERTRGNVVQKMIKWLSTLVFPQQIVGNNRNSDRLSIYLIYGARYFVWKHISFLAVCCTLLSNSYLPIYLQKTTTQKTGKIKKEGINNSVGLETRHLRLVASTPNHYTTETDYVIIRKSLSFYSFSMKLPPAR